MKNIIVPTDFSIKSYNALNLAKTIAKRTKSTIHLIHVVEPIHGRFSSMGETLEEGLDDVFTLKLVKKVKAELSALKTAHSEPDIKITTHLKVGNPFDEIKKLVQDSGSELVILGEKGSTDADEFLLGSLTDKVVRSIPCPVITVKQSMAEETFKNIVYATDLKEEHEPLMDLLIKLQELFDAQIHIVRINTRKDFQNDIDTQVELRQLADKYGLKNYTLNSYSHEDEEHGVVYFADEKKADLIMMGIHERSGIMWLISGGSLAEEVADHTFRPVLTYRIDLD